MTDIIFHTKYSLQNKIQANIELMISNKHKFIVQVIIMLIIIPLTTVSLLIYPGGIYQILLYISIVFIFMVYWYRIDPLLDILGEKRESISIVLNSEGIVISNSMNRLFFSWKSVYQIRETKNYLWILFWDSKVKIFIAKTKEIDNINLESIDKYVPLN